MKSLLRRENSQVLERRKRILRGKIEKTQSSQGITCFECNGHGHFKKECPNYLKAKGKVYAITLSDLDSSKSDSNESCDGEGNFSAFMTIAHVESSDDLSVLVEELGERIELKLIGIVEEFDDEEDEGIVGLQETYNSLLEKTSEYANVAKAAIKKMKRAEEDYRSLLVQYKETKCEMETLNRELTEAYSKIKFLELEVVQANAKVERVSSKKLDEVLAHQKPFYNKSGLGYTNESSSSVKVTKDMKFVKAKEPMVATTNADKVNTEKKKNVTNQRFITKPPKQSVVKPKDNGKSIPKSQRGLRTQHFCHHCGLQGHTRPKCHKLRAFKNESDQRSRRPRNDKKNWAVEQSRGRDGDSGMMDMMKMINAFTTYLANFNRRFESHNTCT